VDRVYEYPGVQVVRMSQVQDALLQILTGIRALLLTFGGLCLVVALMGVFNVALIAMNERRGEMGVLRAMGCSGPTLFSLVWCESLAISLCGAGLGAVLGIVLHGGAEWVVHSSLPFVPAGTVVDITPLILARSSALVVVLCLLAGVYPAWRSAVVAPMTSMRGSV
jgi:putative ABC transport system permease protein